jgi:hypothetical protein
VHVTGREELGSALVRLAALRVRIVALLVRQRTAGAQSRATFPRAYWEVSEGREETRRNMTRDLRPMTAELDRNSIAGVYGASGVPRDTRTWHRLAGKSSSQASTPPHAKYALYSNGRLVGDLVTVPLVECALHSRGQLAGDSVTVSLMGSGTAPKLHVPNIEARCLLHRFEVGRCLVG